MLKNKNPATTVRLCTARREAITESHCTWWVIFLEQGAMKMKVFVKLKSQKTHQIAEG
jgi:hypothetical protein